MTFSRNLFSQRPGETVSEDRFKEVELSTSFKQLQCYACGLTAIYKYRVQQVRRKAEIESSSEEEVRDDHRALWESIPRFAEIPETVRCKSCAEILFLDVECIY